MIGRLLMYLVPGLLVADIYIDLLFLNMVTCPGL